MNAASASLGTLLVQRLDALLGTTLSQQSNLASGARPDAVSQPAQADRSNPANNLVRRHPQENINRIAPRVAAGRTPLTHPGLASSSSTDAPSSVQLRLGATARLILDLLAQYPQHMPVQGKQPLLASLPGQTAHHGAQGLSGLHAPAPASADAPAALLRQGLVQQVQASGMFYESHLAQWVAGARAAASLHGEPQAHVSAGADKPTIAPEIQTVVRQQLEVLANQTFAWQGQVWPDADMRWDIRRHPSPDIHEMPEHWVSHLTLDLPTLGRVQARLTFSGTQVLVHVQAVDCAPQLRQHADALRQRLSNAGVHLTQLSIVADAADVSSPDAACAAAP